MKKTISLFLAFLIFSGFIAESASLSSGGETLEKYTLILGQGEQRLLSIPGLLRYSIGSPIARALPFSHPTLKKSSRKDSLLIKAILPGTTDLWVWKSDQSVEHRTIQIEKLSEIKSNLILEKSLSALQEVEILRMGSGVILRGILHTPAEIDNLGALLRAFPNEIRDETEPTNEILDSAKRNLENWIKTSHHSEQIRIEQKGKTLLMRGFLENPTEKQLAEKEIKKIYPLALLELDCLPDRSPTVFFRVFLLELKKTDFHTLGFNFPKEIPNAFRITPSEITDALKLDVTLQTLEGQGSLKILSRPELSVRVPGEAELFAGGEIPIRIKTRFTSNIAWKKYGLTLQLKVTQIAGTKVRLEILTEVSHINPYITYDELPKIESNRMKTQVDAEFQKPLMLSGLLQQNTKEQAKGIPILRNLPILGSLFQSEDFINERSELVAVLFPLPSPPKPPMQRMEKLFPVGPVPVARDWLSPSEERDLKSASDYPWNILE